MADRAINMALRVLGIGEVERDFKRVSQAGNKSFAEVEKSANGAAREVSEYTARLRRAVAEAKRLAGQHPQLNKPTAQSRLDRRDFIKGAVGGEQDRILKGLPDLTRGLGQASTASDGLGMSLGRMGGMALGAGVTLGALWKAAKAGVEAEIEHEKALNSFNATLSLTGNASEVAGDQIAAMAVRIAAASGQTEAATLKAAAALAKIPGMTGPAMEQALEAAARFADKMGIDVADVVSERVIPVFQALATRDMKALFEATEKLNDPLRLMILNLAAAGKTAEAQQALIKGLADAAGGPDGLTEATTRLGKSWDTLKQKFGQAIEKPAVAALSGLGYVLDGIANKIAKVELSWEGLAYAINNRTSLITSAAGMPYYDTPAGGPVSGMVSGAAKFAKDAAAKASAAGTSAAKAEIEKKYGYLDDKKTRKTSTRTGSTTDLSARSGDMTALIKSLFPGAIVTSTTGGKHGKNSDHPKGNAIDFVLPGMMNAGGTASVYKTLQDAGVDIRRNAKGTEQFFGPGRAANKPGDHDDHFHLAFDGGIPDSDALGKRRAAAAEKEAEAVRNRQRNFAQEKAALDAELLSIKRAGLVETREIAEFERLAVEAAEKRYSDDLDEKVINGQLEEEDAKLLKAQRATVAAAEKAAISRDEQAALAAEALDAERSAIDSQMTLLGLQEGMARTAGERRQIQLQMLALEEKQRRDLAQAILNAPLGTYTNDQRDKAARDLADIDAQHGLREEGIKKRNPSPLDAYIDSMPAGQKEIGERVESLMVAELEAVRGGINRAITNALGVEDPFLAGLLDLLLQEVLFRPLAEALQAARSSGGGGGSGIIGSLLSIGASALGGGIGGGGSGITAIASTDLSSAGSLVGGLGFASGTPGLPEGVPFWVGENGREKMINRGGGRIAVLGNQRAHREAVGGGGSPTVIQHISIPERANPRLTGSHVARATQRGIGMASRKGLAGGGGLTGGGMVR